MTRTISHILVPTDFGPASNTALDYAITVARRFGASLHLLHVVEDPFAGGAWAPEAYITGVPAMRETLIDEAAKKLSSLLPRASGRSVAARSEVRVGRPADAIRQVAGDQQCDLIVMGTHGRSGIAHVVLGSVAEQMLREATCPVLTTRADAPMAAERELFEEELGSTEQPAVGMP